MCISGISVPQYKPVPAVKRNCTTVRLTEHQFKSLPKLKEATGSPSLAITVLLCLHQMHDAVRDNLLQAGDYSPSSEPNPFTFNFVVSADDRQIMAELKSHFGMKTNTQLIGFMLDKYAEALEEEEIPFDMLVMDNDAFYLDNGLDDGLDDGKDGE